MILLPNLFNIFLVIATWYDIWYHRHKKWSECVTLWMEAHAEQSRFFLSRRVKEWAKAVKTLIFMLCGMGPIVVDPLFHSWIVSHCTCAMLSDSMRILLTDLSITCCHLEPKSKCLCSAWRGYNSSKASMMVATSQSIVQWLLMGWRLCVSVG